MYAMAWLGLVDLVDDDTYGVNELTRYTVQVPSCLDGMLHFTTEPLWAAAFLLRQLRDTNFKYPFSELETPTQYGYRLTGETQYADKDFYTILHMQGRMPSLNRFMEGKFGKFGTMPERVKGFGYDLGTVLKSKESEITIVDIGGGRGDMLLEALEAYPHLGKRNLILQDFRPEEVNASRLTVMHWDFRENSPQPIRGALVYSLTHVYHNMGDLDALTLMKKISDAMAPYSRMLVHEFPKNATYGKMNSTMIVQFGGKERNSHEWKQMAALAGLKVTFEAYPVAGEGLVEMIKL